MRRAVPWLFGVAIIILLLSLYFNWELVRKNHQFTINAQGSLIIGVSILNTAISDVQNGDPQSGDIVANEGIGYMAASSLGMEQLGVRHITGLTEFLSRAFGDEAGLNNADSATKRHDEKVITALVTGFKPLIHISPGSISNQKIQQAIDKVYETMTPQERAAFEQAGPAN
jgi:hypothetical protein